MIGKPKIDESFLEQRIEVLVSFDIDHEDGLVTQELHWCGGVVKKISDGPWLLPNALTRCYPENGAAEWDPILFINMRQHAQEYKYFQKVSRIKIKIVGVHEEEI